MPFVSIKNEVYHASLLVLSLLTVPGQAQAVHCGLAQAWSVVGSASGYGSSFGASLGIELEASAPVKVPLKKVARILKEILAQQLQGRPIRINATDEANILVDYAVDGKAKQWRVELGDFPTTSTSVHYGIEIVSPILSSSDDLNLYTTALPLLIDRVGLRAEPDHAGLHFHVEVPDENLAPLVLLEDVFHHLYTQVQAVWPTSPSRLVYANNRKQLYSALGDQVGAINNWLEYSQRLTFDRNCALNLASVVSKGTVEFRLFNSSISLDEISAAGEFSRRLVMAIVTKNQTVMDYLLANSELSLEEIGQILGMMIRPGDVRVLQPFFEEKGSGFNLIELSSPVLTQDAVIGAVKFQVVLARISNLFRQEKSVTAQ